MLNEYRHRFLNESLQFILLDNNSVVVESDDSIFRVMQGESITELHPFFESIPSLLESEGETFKFLCIHLCIHEDFRIVDITILNEKPNSVLIINDLTEHYESYQSAAQARNESVIKTELTVIKNNELEERERFKNLFIQNFSHEIRNPLTSIVAIANILSDTQLTDQQRKMLDFLKESNAALKLMLEDILSLGAIDSGKLQIHEKSFDLTKLFRLLHFTYKTKAKQKNIEFVAVFDERIPDFVEGDRLRLYQILTNLLYNALKYTDSGKISFSVSFNQKWANKVSVRFEVSDTGVGIPEESLESVFESFTQLDVDQNKDGSGLGLAIVKGLLELMGSKIKVTSQVGQGSVFYFDLLLKYPLHVVQEEPKRNTSQIPRDIKRKAKDKVNLLVVEDDERIQTLILKTLVDAEFFNVEILNDGADVLKELVNNQYNLVLMDVDLPNISGDQLTRLIREFPFKNIKDIPIIGLTANAFNEQISSYLASGMNEVLTKPFEKEDLLKAILGVLR